jgi:N-acetylmuramoyl-L-alanine amidase
VNISGRQKVHRDTLWYRVKSPLQTLLLVVLCSFGAAIAQERHNSLAVDEQLNDEAGPYYFISYGDSSNAYAKAAPLAAAMGLRLSYDNQAKVLQFSGNGITARMQATSDVEAGLVKRSGVLTANGTDIASPMAIIVDDVSYVPIVPIAKAFGCDYAWHNQYRLITVNLPRVELPETELPDAVTLPDSPLAGALTVSPFRLGVHDGFTRVAIDLGLVSDYSIAVRADTMLVTFAADSAPALSEERDNGPVRNAYFTTSGGKPALVVRTSHQMSAAGQGFKVGRTAPNTLYIDFGPRLRGSPVAQLVTDPLTEPLALAQLGDFASEPMAVAPAQPQARPVVVIDAGHGGKFAGARHGDVKEEEIVLNVALAAKALLEARGVDVVLTRDSDTALSSDYRQDLSARAAFATNARNLFVSIHANAAANRSASGIETYVFGQALDPRLIERAVQENGGGNEALGRVLTDEALRHADSTAGQIFEETQLNYSRRLGQSVQQNLVDATGAVDRGVKQGPMFVIRNARTPAILVEIGFVTNAEEGRKLLSKAYQATLARALVDGIIEFLETGGTLASN